jgi:uncharacterized protein
MSDPYGPPPPEQPEGETPGQQPAGQPAYGQPPAQNPYGQQPPYPQQPGAGGLTVEERNWGGAAHWSALIAGVVTGGVLGFVGPLIVMLTKGNESQWVRRQSVESLNFQLSILIYGIVSGILIIVLIGFVLLAVVGICWLVFTIIGAVKAAGGDGYRYPLTIRMVS